MEIHIQKCQKCGSRDLRNILVRDEQQKVFVQCRQCDALVARYILESGGYYHSGKDVESFLRSIERDGGLTSARDLMADFEQLEASAKEEFKTLLTTLTDKYGDTLP